jgi:hypothetical protein
MDAIKAWAPTLLPLVLAVLLPPAGLLLALLTALNGDRPFGLRIALAAILGACLYAIALTA